MATGDLEGNLRKLRRELARVRYSGPCDDTECAALLSCADRACSTLL